MSLHETFVLTGSWSCTECAAPVTEKVMLRGTTVQDGPFWVRGKDRLEANLPCGHVALAVAS